MLILELNFFDTFVNIFLLDLGFNFKPIEFDFFECFLSILLLLFYLSNLKFLVEEKYLLALIKFEVDQFLFVNFFFDFNLLYVFFI